MWEATRQKQGEAAWRLHRPLLGLLTHLITCLGHTALETQVPPTHSLPCLSMHYMHDFCKLYKKYKNTITSVPASVAD